MIDTVRENGKRNQYVKEDRKNDQHRQGKRDNRSIPSSNTKKQSISLMRYISIKIYVLKRF